MAKAAPGETLTIVLVFTTLVTLLVGGIGLALGRIFEPKTRRKDR